MKVHGYTDDKIVFLAELSIARICATGIDPWRVDLLDSQPVPLEVDGQVLYFRRLRDVAFAYQLKLDDRQAILCRHDGEDAMCLIGDCVEPMNSDRNCLQLRNVRVSERPFADHLAEYLGLSDSDLLAVPPRNSAALTIRGERVSLDLKSRSLVQAWINNYTGEMEEETVAAVLLDERINWVFETLNQFNPVVAGKAILSSLTDIPLDQIGVTIDEPGLKVLVDEHGAVMDEGETRCRLERGGCQYAFTSRLFPITPLVDAMMVAFRPIGGEELYSIDTVFSVRSNQVRGYRIGIYDLSQKQFRPLSPETISQMDEKDSRAAELQALGLTLIRCEADKPCHYV
jgi:hypothetical protein